MAISSFTKSWANSPVPYGNAKANTGHPLCPMFGFVMNNGWHDLVRKTPVIQTAGTGAWRATGLRGRPCIGREHTTTSDVDRINVDALVIFPQSQDVSILIAQQFIGNGGGINFSSEVTNNVVFNTACYMPFTDGKVYWDWGGQTEGSTRLSVAGLTMLDDIFVFTTGPRGMEIWQNGVLRASNAANPSKSIWGAGTENMCWGKNGFGTTSGLQINKATFVYWKQLPARAIVELSNDPLCWVTPRA